MKSQLDEHDDRRRKRNRQFFIIREHKLCLFCNDVSAMAQRNNGNYVFVCVMRLGFLYWHFHWECRRKSPLISAISGYVVSAFFLSLLVSLAMSCLVFDFGQSAKQNENQFSSIKQVFFVFVQIIALHYECTRSFVASGAHFRSLKITEIAFKTPQQDARIYVLFFSLFGTEKETVQKNQRNDLSEAVALSCIGEHPIEHRFYPT